MTWADIAQRPAQPPPEQSPVELEAGGSTAVLDASAIIGGFDRQVAQGLVTVPAALEECKDALAQQRIRFLPEAIRVQQPSSESIKRGVHHLTSFPFQLSLPASLSS